MEDKFDFENILNNSENVHYNNEVISQKLLRHKAQQYFLKNEIASIYYLTESHSPALRINTSLKWKRNLAKMDLNQDVAVKCTNSNLCDNVNIFLEKIKELPKEWTLVQLTSQYNPEDLVNFDNSLYSTPAIYISPFNCGKCNPFVVSVSAPRDPVNGGKMSLLSELYTILKLSRENMRVKSGPVEIEKIITQKAILQDRLKNVILDIQNLWLKEWRCLLVGKLVDEKLENKVRNDLINFFKKLLPDVNLSEKCVNILLSATKCSGIGHLKPKEITNILLYCFPQSDESFLKNSRTFLKNCCEKYDLKYVTKNPVILILDDCLDIIPWEMIDILQSEPVSRLPAFHFVYYLYKEHQNDIKEGYKIITQYNKGSYIVNPDEDLKNMEIRIMNFFNYWCPEWIGVSGYKPTNDEFYELLTSSDIFSYNGHGSGSQHFVTERLQNTHVKAIVLLFGCSSTKIQRQGTHLGYHGKYYSYLMAGCPCVVGMLWEVTDVDTDVLTTEFLSHWIPSNAEVHWKHINKTKWKQADKSMKFALDETLDNGNVSLEPELLRALSVAKKDLKYITTKAACIARGIPVKIEIPQRN